MIISDGSSKFESCVYGYDSKVEVLIGGILEPAFLYHAKQSLLVLELIDTLNQLLIRGLIFGDNAAHRWNHIEGVESVELVERELLDLAKLQAQVSPTLL